MDVLSTIGGYLSGILSSTNTDEIEEGRVEPCVAVIKRALVLRRIVPTFSVPLVWEFLPVNDTAIVDVCERTHLHGGADNGDDVYLNRWFRPMKYFQPFGVVMEFETRDQGWSSNPREQHGTTTGSWTWVELCLVSANGPHSTSSPLLRRKVHTNLHAGREWEEVNICAGEDVMKEMSSAMQVEGAVGVQIRARSQFPGWRCRMRGARLTVRYAMRVEHLVRVLDDFPEKEWHISAS